jgi:hypothetical protein
VGSHEILKTVLEVTLIFLAVGGWSFNLGASYCTLYTFALNFNEETSSFTHVTSPQASQVTLNTFYLNFNEEFLLQSRDQPSGVPGNP